MTMAALPGITALAVALMMLLGLPAIARVRQQISIHVTTPRPLSNAAFRLEQLRGLTITYEDPLWEYGGDFEEVSLSIARDGGSFLRKVPRPRTESLTFVRPLAADGSIDPPEVVVDALVEAYNSSGAAARFRVVQTGRIFHIVPAMSRNEAGVLVPRGSLLDFPVSFAEGERTLLSVVQEIARQVSEASGVPVEGGTMAMNLLIQTRISIGAGKEDARAVLVRALGMTGRPLSWHLLCGLDGTRSCALNIYLVSPGP